MFTSCIVFIFYLYPDGIPNTGPTFTPLTFPKIGSDFQGTLDDFKLYSRPLADHEINYFRNTEAGPKYLNTSAPLTIAENQPIGTNFGEFNATDPDTNASLTYHLVSGVGDIHNSLFTLNHLNLDSTPSLLVWLDGNDSSSIRRDGSGFVDLWEDKSGKDNDFEDYTTDGRPTVNPSGGVTFANGKWLVTQPWTGSTLRNLQEIQHSQ